ncbi:MAG: 4Fe-4S binding protein, partial [Candidatus Eisenbacteria bacterium]|nr:4Fe-4S binding protein [Candidatus Eisenbacteria bacterium]
HQAVGFPATQSGAEIKILKHIFTPSEAEIATCLTYKFEPLETIYNRARHLVETPLELEKILESTQKKGGLECKIKDGKRQYCNAPLVVGMYEFQLGRLTPEFIKNFDEYTSDKKFGIDLLSTELPQMRTIPIEESLRVESNVSTFDEVRTLMQKAEEPFVILECICRKKKSLQGRTCKVTDRHETCLAIGPMAQSARECGLGREISREAAMTILEKNQQEGLILQPSNTERAEFICSCCGCCCGMLLMHKRLPNPLDFWASNFYAEADSGKCEGCGVCEERCQVQAVTVSKDSQTAVVDLNRCLGCGVCVSLCPTEAITLVKKQTEVKPPPTREDLYDIIMAKKKSRLGKLKLQGKMVYKAIRTGQADHLQ